MQFAGRGHGITLKCTWTNIPHICTKLVLLAGLSPQQETAVPVCLFGKSDVELTHLSSIGNSFAVLSGWPCHYNVSVTMTTYIVSWHWNFAFCIIGTSIFTICCAFFVILWNQLYKLDNQEVNIVKMQNYFL